MLYALILVGVSALLDPRTCCLVERDRLSIVVPGEVQHDGSTWLSSWEWRLQVRPSTSHCISSIALEGGKPTHTWHFEDRFGLFNSVDVWHLPGPAEDK